MKQVLGPLLLFNRVIISEEKNKFGGNAESLYFCIRFQGKDDLLAQLVQSACFTRKRSRVQISHRSHSQMPPSVRVALFFGGRAAELRRHSSELKRERRRQGRNAQRIRERPQIDREEERNRPFSSCAKVPVRFAETKLSISPSSLKTKSVIRERCA